MLIFSINLQNNKIRALEMIDFLIRNCCLTTSHKQGNGIPQIILTLIGDIEKLVYEFQCKSGFCFQDSPERVKV